jgi:hypothetical protein
MGGVDGTDIEVLKQRSPAFPYIPLDAAVERIRQIYKNIRDTPQPREQVAKAYGKPVSSSSTVQTFATLLQYGLLENVNLNGSRRLKVSSLARTIVHPNAPKYQVDASLKKSALLPQIFKEMWDLYKYTDDVSDDIILFYLTHDREDTIGSVFTERAAQDVLRVYRATLAYAGIVSSTDNQNNVEASDEWDDSQPNQRSQIDMSPQARGEPATAQPPNAVQKQRIGMAYGEREIQTGMLSKTATFRVIVSGKVGVKEIEMLIKKLEFDKELLADNEEPEVPFSEQ